MNTSTINIVANIAGQTFPVQISRTTDGAITLTPKILAGTAKASTGYTNATNVDVTVAQGHGFMSSDKLDLFWDSGRRYNCSVAVTGNSLRITGGSGDPLPVSDTAITVCKRVSVNATVDPDDMSVLLISATRRASVELVDAGGAVLFAVDVTAGEFCIWFDKAGIARPFTGNPVAAIWVSSGDTAIDNDITVAVVYDATPAS